MVAAIRSAQAGRSARHRPAAAQRAALRQRVPASERDRFDDLLEVAQRAYGHNDDNTTVLLALPLGLVRRAALEVGRRQTAAGRLHDPHDALEAGRLELPLLAVGEGPSADELAARVAERRAAAAVVPPSMVGTPAPAPPEPAYGPSTLRLAQLRDRYWSMSGGGASTPERAAASVGDTPVRGRAIVVHDPLDALVRLEPGDVLVTLTTTAAFNTVFPAAAGVAVEQGNLLSHAAILARELGLPAVIGVPGLLERIQDGDLVELDPVAGTITVVS
jgi:pyruvate,water dikinase